MAIGTTAAILGSAAIGAGASIAQGNSQRRAASTAANAARDTSDAQTRLYRDIFNQQRQDLEPFRQYELQRANAIGELFGFDPVGQPAAANTNVPGGSQPDANALMRYINNGGAPSFGGFGGFTGGNPASLAVSRFADGPVGYATPGGVPTDAIASMAPTGAPDRSAVLNALRDKLPVQDAVSAAQAQPTAANDGGLAPTLDPSVAGADRFNNSAFNAIFTNNFNRDTDRIDASLGNEVFNGARTNAIENSRANNFQNAFGQYINTMMGTPSTPATNSSVNAAGAYGANAGNAIGAAGNAAMQSAYARGNASSNMINGLAGAAGWGITSLSKPGGSFSIG